MDNKAYGYLKSSEQNHMKTLEQYVKDKRSIVTDEKSSRDGYNYLKNHMLRKGDILYIVSLGTLGNSFSEIKTEYLDFIRRRCYLKILDNPYLSTAEKSDDIILLLRNTVYELLSYAEKKESIVHGQKCREGIAKARERGVRVGRPPVRRPDNWGIVITEYESGKITASEAMKKMGLKRNTFYKFLNIRRNGEDTAFNE